MTTVQKILIFKWNHIDIQVYFIILLDEFFLYR